MGETREHGVAPSWSMEANSGIRGRVRAAQKAPEGDDRQTDTHTIGPLYDDFFLVDFRA